METFKLISPTSALCFVALLIFFGLAMTIFKKKVKPIPEALKPQFQEWIKSDLSEFDTAKVDDYIYHRKQFIRLLEIAIFLYEREEYPHLRLMLIEGQWVNKRMMTTWSASLPYDGGLRFFSLLDQEKFYILTRAELDVLIKYF